MSRYTPEEVNALFNAVFTQEKGEHVFNILKKKFYDSPSNMQAVDGVALGMLLSYQAGQRDLIKYIENQKELKPRSEDERDTVSE